MDSNQDTLYKYTMTYSNVTVYYTSGTGNSFRAAAWLTNALAKDGASTQLVPVDSAAPKTQLLSGKGQLVGLYHPAHGLMPPWSMIKFLLFRLPFGKGAHGIVVATRGGIPIPKVVIPGGGGLALFFPLLVLLLKGYRVRGALGLDMPCNLLNIHWGITKQNTERMIGRAKARHDLLCNAMVSGRQWVSLRNLLWELLWCIPYVFYPLWPFIYLTISRVFMAKLMFADTSCKHCGACARHCPREAIKMMGPKNKTPFWTWRCEVCMRCMGYCRHRSIQASHLWGVLLGFGLSFISADFIQRILMVTWSGLPPAFAPISTTIAWTLYFFALIPAYYLFYGMLRIKPIHSAFTLCTFTKLYRRRYHEPETRVKDLVTGQINANEKR